MRIAILADSHSNFEALSAVIAAAHSKNITTFIHLGDLIGYGPDPGECLKLARALGMHCIQGNHEHALFHPESFAGMNPVAQAAHMWTQAKLEEADRRWIQTWPLIEVSEAARLVHGAPWEPAAFHYVCSQFEQEQAFKEFQEPLCWMGHTHRPLLAEEIVRGVVRAHTLRAKVALDPKSRYLINPGSVGQPRNRIPAAQWIIWDVEQGELFFERTPYPWQRNAEKIIKTGLPKELASRLELGV
jgi:predicted phosphodiesterase